MRTFSSELGQSYSFYSFGYCNYAVAEPNDTFSNIYQQGYLPYSGARDVVAVYYMARSIRINLADWTLNSENRRIRAKFDRIEKQIVPLGDFDIHAETFLSFCLEYFKAKHGEQVMPKARLTHILSASSVTDIVRYRYGDRDLGYVFLVQDADMAHFYYSFYDLAYANQSLGLWLMTDMAIWANENQKQHFYLGTAYGEKGLYKTNFDGIEYWNGYHWVANRDQLRQRCKSDDERTLGLMDEWKDQIKGYLF